MTAKRRQTADLALWRRRFPAILLAIAVAALVIRLVVSADLANTYSPVTRPSDQTDLYTYQTYAHAIAAGEYDYSKGFYYQPFYYAVFLPLAYALPGGDAWNVIIAQSLLGALTVWLLGSAFSRLGGKRVGLAAALLLAVSRMHVFYTPFAMIAVLQAFWMTLLLWLGLLAWRRRSPWLWGLMGLAAGCANLTRGNIILMVPVILVVIWREGRHCRRHLTASIVLFLLAFYLPQLPFSIVNYQATGRWTGPSTAAGAVLGLGNTPEAPPGGREPGQGAGPMDYPTTYHAWMALDDRSREDRVPLTQNIRDWVTREPLAFIELKWRMLLVFWYREEVPNNVAIESATNARWIRSPLLLDFMLLGGLGLAGALLGPLRKRRSPTWWLAGGLLWLYAGSIVAFYMLARFRLPAVPLICGFAAWFLIDIYQRYRTYRRDHANRQGLLLGILGMMLSLFVVAFGIRMWQWYVEPTVMRLARPAGVRVDLPDYVMLKDNGPQPFGGWETVDITDSAPSGRAMIRVEKTFALLPEHRDEIRWARLQISLFGNFDTTPSPIPVEIAVSRGDAIYAHIRSTVNYPGVRTITVDLPPEALDLTGDSLTFETLILVPHNRAMIIVDRQRDYGRTRIDGDPTAGEWVATLELHKDDPPPPPPPLLQGP